MQFDLAPLDVIWSAWLTHEYWAYERLDADANKSMLPVLAHLGYHIAQGGKGGTMGLHLRLGFDKSKTYCLVSRHVAVNSRLRYDVDYKYLDPATSGRDQDSLDITYPLSAVQKALDNLQAVECWIQGHTRVSRRNKEEDRATEEDLKNLKLGDALHQYISTLSCGLEAVQQVSPEDVSIQQRTLGHVAFSPKHDVHIQHGFLRDWALVELDMSQFQQDPENKVYIGDALYKQKVDKFPEEKYKMFHYFDDQMFLPIRGTRPGTLTTRKREAFRVRKRGMTSGLTFGLVGEIEAVLRKPLGDGQGEQISLALLIISSGRKWSNDSGPNYHGPDFSQPGDSGSCIFDFSGRAVGILDAGQSSYHIRRFEKVRAEQDSTSPLTAVVPPGHMDFDDDDESYGKRRRMTTERDIDVTFATPIQWILEDIEAFTGKKPEIIWDI